MTTNHGLPLVAPKVAPVLEPEFRPAVLTTRAFDALAMESGRPVPCGSLSSRPTARSSASTRACCPAAIRRRRPTPFTSSGSSSSSSGRAAAGASHVDGPADAGRARWPRTIATPPTGRFDAHLVGERMFDHPLEVVHTTRSAAGALGDQAARPAPRGLPHRLRSRRQRSQGGGGRSTAGSCSARRRSGIPYHKPDPQYHFDGIMDSLQKAAAHLPRVDAIGGSAAGVYVNNRVKAGSLFRGVPQDVFDARVKDLFLEIRKAWNDVPFEVVNDGEVTALAGSMSLGENAILGIALGTSTAAGYVTPDGNITSWLERAGVRAGRLQPGAPVDEWSGDYGVGSQYFSQQAVGRLMPVAGIDAPADMPLPERAEARPGAHGRGRPARQADLPDHRHVPRLRRRAFRRLLRSSPRAGARARHLRARRRRHRRRRARRCSTSSSRSWPGGSRSTCPTSTTSVTARPSPPPACRHSPGERT